MVFHLAILAIASAAPTTATTNITGSTGGIANDYIYSTKSTTDKAGAAREMDYQ